MPQLLSCAIEGWEKYKLKSNITVIWKKVMDLKSITFFLYLTVFDFAVDKQNDAGKNN